MGNYNPYIPQILGQEWVPIKEQPLTLTPNIDLIEVGHAFTLSSSKVIQTARFYVRDWPPGITTSQVLLASVYRHDTETRTGPIQSVVVPCSLGSTTGGTVTIANANNIASALFSPSDNSQVIVDTGAAPIITLRFDTEYYLQQLIGKRILSIDFLYTATMDDAGEAALTVSVSLGSTGSTAFGLGDLVPTTSSFTGEDIGIGRMTVGEVDFHWSTPVTNFVEVLPWSPNRVRAFDNGSGLTDRSIRFSVDVPPSANQTVSFKYAALEIFFCEEQRVLWGGRRYSSGNNYVLGANQITMRDLTDTANPTLSPGQYDLVVSSAELPIRDSSVYPELNQLRELYPIPPHPATRVLRPFPLYASIGREFTDEQTLLLPQLSLHTSGGPLTEVHVYGRQAVAQVYGSIIAAQEIYDTPAGGAASYPWVRYYARRFGDTTVPLKLSSPTIAGSDVEITPVEFDALDEIIDGWKEVTLRFDTPPSMGSGTNPQWRWTAAGELSGNRWEILGAYAPALSGAPFNPFNKVPSPHQLSLATYGAPVSGAAINLSWLPQYAPPVSAVIDDDTADATLIFAVDQPTVTGFGATPESQELTGIGLDCGVNPCCIPSALDYVEVTWGLPFNTGVAADTWTRTETGTWGTPDIGPAYSYSGVIADFSANGEQGLITFSFAAGTNYASLATGSVNFDQTVEVTFDALPGSSVFAGGILGRFTSSNDTYMAQARITSTGALSLRLTKFVGGVETTLGEYTLGDLLMAAESTVSVRFAAYGGFLKAKLWKGEDEPSMWGIEVTDTSHTTSGTVGLFATNGTGAGGPVFRFDNYTVGPPQPWFGYYELQRMDTVTTDWQTIMKATTAATTGFNDYEARVGILSSYRIRAVDVYDFPGQWSSTVTATVPEPGVTIGCEGGHLLLFTSNEAQDGSLNLAYSSVWEGKVEENFVFPEARFVELQAMYNRDFFVAFRPMERGGEQFSRTVLVQAAAINPETLADFTSLRDMAWADVPYICVRDEDGNRWFTTVLVPGGRVTLNRTLYMAQVEILEVTDTPSEVDP